MLGNEGVRVQGTSQFNYQQCRCQTQLGEGVCQIYKSHSSLPRTHVSASTWTHILRNLESQRTCFTFLNTRLVTHKLDLVRCVCLFFVLQRELADARKQRFAHQNATHVAKVRQVRVQFFCSRYFGCCLILSRVFLVFSSFRMPAQRQGANIVNPQPI